MEDCHLTFTLPKLGETLEKGATYAMHPYSRFDIFRLEADRLIDVKKLSFRTKPLIAEKVSTVQAGLDGDMLIHRFPCAWSSLHAFEIACADGEKCLLDTWSSHNTTYGKHSCGMG